MTCSNGRVRLSRDQDRRLSAESAGTCLLCSAPLFPDLPTRRRSISVAERAHIVAHSPGGPRGKGSAEPAGVDDPANLVLLCPTCHTKVDKAPEVYPAEVLLARKMARAAAVARVGGAVVFDSRDEARAAVSAILRRNRETFRTSGPSPADGSIVSMEAATKWSGLVLNEIVPGNELIVAMVEMNPGIATESDLEAAEELRAHTRDLAEKHRGTLISAPALRFPRSAEMIFSENPQACR